MNYEKVENLEYQDPMETTYAKCNEILNITNESLSNDKEFEPNIKDIGADYILTFPISEKTRIELRVLVVAAEVNKLLFNGSVTSISMWFYINSDEDSFSDDTCFDINVFYNKINYYCGICKDTISTINEEDSEKIFSWIDKLREYCNKQNVDENTEDTETVEDQHTINNCWDNGVSISGRG